jgi:hypothetical protein
LNEALLFGTNDPAINAFVSARAGVLLGLVHHLSTVRFHNHNSSSHIIIRIFLFDETPSFDSPLLQEPCRFLQAKLKASV